MIPKQQNQPKTAGWYVLLGYRRNIDLSDDERFDLLDRLKIYGQKYVAVAYPLPSHRPLPGHNGCDQGVLVKNQEPEKKIDRVLFSRLENVQSENVSAAMITWFVLISMCGVRLCVAHTPLAAQTVCHKRGVLYFVFLWSACCSRRIRNSKSSCQLTTHCVSSWLCLYCSGLSFLPQLPIPVIMS